MCLQYSKANAKRVSVFSMSVVCFRRHRNCPRFAVLNQMSVSSGSLYFSCRKKFQICCHICGSFVDLVPITDEKRRKFQTIHQNASKVGKLSTLVALDLLARNVCSRSFNYIKSSLLYSRFFDEKQEIKFLPESALTLYVGMC